MKTNATTLPAASKSIDKAKKPAKVAAAGKGTKKT